MLSRWFRKKNTETLALEKGTAPVYAGADDLNQVLRAGLAHHQAGRIVEAEAVYRKVLSADAKHFDALHLLGLALHQSGRSEQGARYVADAVAIVPGNAAALSNLAEIYRTLSRVNEARECCERALSLQPDFAEAHQNLGLLLDQQGQLPEAR